jgi:CSLREA domain-containing protein
VALGTLTAVGALAWAAPAAGDVLEVTRHNDPPPGPCKRNDCSLREAIRAANESAGKDSVVLPDRKRPYELTRTNLPALVDEDASERGDLDLRGKLRLRHPGKGMATIDANTVDRVIEVSGTALIERIRITGGGNVSQEAPRAALPRTTVAGSGGGIEVHGKLTLTRSAVVRNTGAATGGGINAEPDFTKLDPPRPSVRLIRSTVARNRTIQGTGGGIEAADADLTVSRSKVIGNRAENAGGGLYVHDAGILRLVKSTVSGNRGDAGNGGIYLYAADGRITQSTVSGNRTGPNARTGGVQVTLGDLTIANSTVYGNRAADDAGGINSTSSSSITLRSVTVVGNLADSDLDGTGVGGGILEDAGNVIIRNSLVASNQGLDGTAGDCYGALTSEGGNLLGTDADCTGFDAAGDAVRPNPKLGKLRRNGGPTKTVALKRGSPAIGRAVSPAPKRDQRGRKRDRNPDTGAFER